MDLDKIKKSWGEASLKPEIGDDKIEQMISHEGQSAFNKLFKYEKIGTILIVFCVAISFVLHHPPVIIFYIVTCLLAFCWQLHKVRLFKKVDTLRMGVVEISRFYLTYRKYIIYELFFSIIWVIAMIGLFGYFEYINNWSLDMENVGKHILIFALSFAFVFSIAILIIILYFWKNFEKLGRSVKEVKEFEEEEPLTHPSTP